MTPKSHLFFHLSFICTIFLIYSPQLHAETNDPLADADPTVLVVTQGQFSLSEGILGFLTPAGVLYIPLSELSQAIGLAIEFDLTNQQAAGFYLLEKNRFSLDLKTKQVTSNGQVFKILPGTVLRNDFDFFVTLKTLNSWFSNIQFKLFPEELTLQVASDPPLPIIRRLFRENARPKTKKKTKKINPLDLPVISVDYEIFRPPAMDLGLRSSWDNDKGFSTNLTVQGVQDFAKLATEWHLELNQDRLPQDFRITFNRKDPEGQLFLPLAITEVEAGDIAQQNMPLVSRGFRGAGIRFTNKGRDIVSGTTTELRGILPTGWEAELYHNNIFIAFDDSPAAGEYVFPDIPLHAGNNELRVMLFGPQGQQKKEVETIRLGTGQPAPGKWYFELSALQQNQPLVPVQEWFHNDPSRTATETPLSAWNSAYFTADARVHFSLKPGLSVALGGVTIPQPKIRERQNFAVLSTEFSPLNVVTNIDYARAESGESAIGARFLGQLMHTGFLLQYATFQPHFNAPANNNNGILQDQIDLRLNRNFRFSTINNFSFNTFLTTEYKRFAQAKTTWIMNLATAMTRDILNINNQLNLALKGQETVGGTLSLATQTDWGRFKGELAYQLAPNIEGNRVGFGGQIPLFDDLFKLNTNIQHSFGQATSFNCGIALTLPFAELSTQVSYDTASENLRAGINLRFSLSPQKDRFLPHIDKKSVTQQGGARINVFVDIDHNGLPSPGDEPLAGVAFAPSQHGTVSDEQGTLTLSNISELIPTDVLIQEATLPDPFLKSLTPGYHVITRPGTLTELNFPVIHVSNIEGTAFITRKKADKNVTEGLGNVLILILDDQDQEVMQVRSEYDGFFAAAGLPSGEYRLIISPQQAKRFQVDDQGGITFQLHDDTLLLPGLELHLHRKTP